MNESKPTSTNAQDQRSLASMIANGELPVPIDWPEDRLLILLNDVHNLRRRRLVSFIARAIARDICREQRQEES